MSLGEQANKSYCLFFISNGQRDGTRLWLIPVPSILCLLLGLVRSYDEAHPGRIRRVWAPQFSSESLGTFEILHLDPNPILHCADVTLFCQLPRGSPGARASNREVCRSRAAQSCGVARISVFCFHWIRTSPLSSSVAPNTLVYHEGSVPFSA